MEKDKRFGGVIFRSSGKVRNLVEHDGERQKVWRDLGGEHPVGTDLVEHDEKRQKVWRQHATVEDVLTAMLNTIEKDKRFGGRRYPEECSWQG